MSGTTTDLIPISEAAKTLRRSVRTLRRWANRGRTPTGRRFRAIRDGVTNIRFFDPIDVERVRADLFG